MKVEWSKWTESGAYKKLPPRELKELLRRNPGTRPAGTRWVFTSKGPNPMKAPPRRSRMPAGQVTDPHGCTQRI
eukprot:7440324-Pyramimonas_sp.AAC.1